VPAGEEPDDGFERTEFSPRATSSVCDAAAGSESDREPVTLLRIP